MCSRCGLMASGTRALAYIRDGHMRLTRSAFLTFLAALPVTYAAGSRALRLHVMAKDRHSLLSVIILCRMLFMRRHGSVHSFELLL